MAKEKILITCALPYVNNIPHLGNIIQVLSADVFARYQRHTENEVLYVCGTDEHGTTTETIAMKEGLSPQEVCDKYYKIHKEIYEWFNISFDHFGRTSTHFHHEITQDIFTKAFNNGYIIEKDLEQPYCPKCEKYLADRFVEGTCPHCGSENARGDQCEDCSKVLDAKELLDPHCAICGGNTEIRTSKHLFLDLPRLSDRLKEWAEDKMNWSQNARNFTLGWISEGLEQRCITRDLEWGVKVPLEGWDHKVFYVWFDACIGYISITAEYSTINGTKWEYWWKDPKTKLFQFMGKDNVPFHTIMFPATLMAADDGYILVHQLSSTEYLNYEGGAFSKSRNRGIFGTDVLDSGIPVDVWRYYIYINRPEKSDVDFTWDDFQRRNNDELVGNLGNFIYRAQTFAKKYYDLKVPDIEDQEVDDRFYEEVAEVVSEIGADIANTKLKSGLKNVMKLSKMGNQFFQENEPWKNEDRRANTVKTALNLCASIAIVLEPYMPTISEEIWKGLDQKGDVHSTDWEQAKERVFNGGESIQKPNILFKKLEDEFVKDLKTRYSGKAKKQEEVEMIEYEDFSKCKFKVAEILTAEKVEKSDKLLKLSIDLGDEKRQLVAGLAQYYSPEEMVGKKIIVVANLKPAKLFGIESQGMLLAAEKGDDVKLLTVDGDIEAGAEIR
ncbi:MAG TPA: methionine--tRNA ligase [Candidatus Methanofastidiosa archaeon]|nr:methionine--tRNA ligase [Candidatus Methanofastidiosa archaeon]